MDERASAIDGAGDVVSIEVALHGDGLLDVDGAGAGVGVEVELCTIAYVETDRAGAGAETPVGGGLAVGFDIA